MSFNIEQWGSERHPIADHPIWPRLLPYLSADAGKQNNSIILVKRDIPAPLLREACAAVVKCHCGLPFHPVRGTTTKGSKRTTYQLYATGPRDDGHKSCSYPKICKAQIVWLSFAVLRANAPKDATPPSIGGETMVM